MAITPTQYADMLARLGATDPVKGREIKAKVERELELHYQIIRYCNAQWPVWKHIRARSDQPSTIQEGAQDFTIFLPGKRIICIEVKSKDGKLSPSQLAWRTGMQMLEHEVHVVRSFEEFLALVKPKPTPFEATQI